MLGEDGLGEPKLIGRDEELEKLDRSLQLAFEGKGNTIFISGEAGSGKTRLAAEFLTYAMAKNVATLSGWCLSNAAIPYFPFIEAFDCYISNNDGRVTNSQQAVKTWLVESNDRGKNSTKTPQAWKDQAFAEVLRQLLIISTNRPAVLFIDDLHWADSASLALLHYIARSISSERILVVATFRSEEVNVSGSRNQLSETLRLMGREGLFKEMKLPNLSQAHVGEIVESMLGGKANPQFVQKLAAESQGLPLFVVESLRMLHEQKALIRDVKEWRLAVDDFGIPAKVKDVILRRIGALTPKQKRILEAASAVGEKFDPKLIAAVVSQDSFNIFDALNAMSNTLLVYCEDDYYRFSHAKIRELLYDQIPNLLKKEYHLRIAERLEASTQNVEEINVADLAYHYAQAGDKTKSIKFAIAAGNIALAKFSSREALKHFTYALQMISEDSNLSEKKVALEGLGEAFFANCMFEEAVKAFEQLSDIGTGAVKLRALRRAMDSAFFQGQFTYLLELTKKSEEYIGFDRLEGARVLMNRARAFTFLGNHELGTKDFEEALKIFEEECSLPDIARVLLGLGGASNRIWGFEQGLVNALRSIILFDELCDARGLMDAYNRAGQSFGYRMLNAEALQFHQKAIQIGLKIGDSNRVAEANASSAWIFEATGDYDKALSASLKALECLSKTDSQWTYGITCSNLVREYAKLGDIERAEKYFEQLVDMPQQIILNGFVRFGLSKAILLAAKNQWKEAKDCYEENKLQLKTGISPSIEINARKNHADVLDKLGFVEESQKQLYVAKRLVKKLERHFQHSNIRATLLALKQVEIGKNIPIRLDLFNISLRSTLLKAIEGLVPEGFRAINMPSYYGIQDDSLVVKSKVIGPFQVETIKLDLQPIQTGIFSLNPQVLYTDDLGRTKRCICPSVTIAVSSKSSIVTKEKDFDAKPLEIQFKTQAARKTFSFLTHAFIEDFTRRKMSQTWSGWRTLMDIVKEAKVTKHSVYGVSGSQGRAISELERLGLVEARFFLGERGRGGRILKVRIVYENEAVRSHIEYSNGKQMCDNLHLNKSSIFKLIFREE